MIVKCLDGTDISLLSNGSSRKIIVVCDDCGIEFITDYRNVVATNGRWCRKCCHIHKKKRIYTEEQKKQLSELTKVVHTGKIISKETKKKISDSKKKPIEYYVDLLKDNYRIKYENSKWMYQCNKCNIWFELRICQFNEVIKQYNKRIEGNNFCSKNCKNNYLKDNFSHTFFQSGHNQGGSSWNKGINTPSDTKKKISDGFNKNLEQHRYNMRLAAIKRIKKLKEEGKILTYPNRGIGEINCVNELRQLLPQYHVIDNKEIYGYFVDAYIPELNLSLEFDERHHFKYNSDHILVLVEEDIKRQQEIQNYCSCDFFRISELDWNLKKEEIKTSFMNKIKCLEHKITLGD